MLRSPHRVVSSSLPRIDASASKYRSRIPGQRSTQRTLHTTAKANNLPPRPPRNAPQPSIKQVGGSGASTRQKDRSDAATASGSGTAAENSRATPEPRGELLDLIRKTIEVRPSENSSTASTYLTGRSTCDSCALRHPDRCPYRAT